MATLTAMTAEDRFHEASEHLYQAILETYGHNFGAHQPIIRAIAEYGQACRHGADWRDASEHVYTALHFNLGSGFGANQRIIRALSEYGQACRDAGMAKTGTPT